MPKLNTASDLLEVDFTPEELHAAMQLGDKALSQMYLQNMKVAKIRLRLAVAFNEKAKDEDNMRQVAWLDGQIALLAELCENLMYPTPIPQEMAQPPGNFQG